MLPMLFLPQGVRQAVELEPTSRQSCTRGTDLPLSEMQQRVRCAERVGQPFGKRELWPVSVSGEFEWSGVREPVENHAVSDPLCVRRVSAALYVQ